MAVSKRLRYEVMRRDGFRCRYCGFTGADTVLQVDHVQPGVAVGTGGNKVLGLIGAAERDRLENFYDAELDIETVERFVTVAMRNDRVYGAKTFRYFCGCCWNQIRERQAIARALVEREEHDA